MLLGARTVTFDEAGGRTLALRVERGPLKGRDAARIKLVAKTRDLAQNHGRVRESVRLR